MAEQLPPQRLPAVQIYPAPAAFPEGAVEPDALPLKEYAGVLRRHLWLVIGATLLAGGVSAYNVSRERPEYQATAVIRLTDARRALTSGIGDGGASGLVGGGTDPLLSQMQVLQSRSVARTAVVEAGLQLAPAEGPTYVPLDSVTVDSTAAHDTLSLAFAPGGFTVRGRAGEARAEYGMPVRVDGVRFTVSARPRADDAQLVVESRSTAVRRVMEKLAARPRERTDVVDVSFTAYDPYRAARVVNSVVYAYQQENANAAQRDSRRRREFVAEQLDATTRVLAAEQQELNDFLRRKDVSPSDRFAAEQKGVIELSARRQEMAADRQMYQSLLDRLRVGGESARLRELETIISAPGIASNPVFAQLYGQLVEYQTARDSLTTGRWSAAATNPDVQRLNALISSTKERLAGAVQSHIAAVDAQLTAIDHMQAQNAAEIQRLPDAQAEEVRLRQAVESTSQVADQLREELQKARISEAVEMGQVEIVDPATFPAEPIKSGRTRKVVFGLLVGLMLGGGGAFLLERLNTSIRRRDELEGVLQVPGLAVIPRLTPLVNGDGHLRRALLRPRLRPLPTNTGGLITISDLRSAGAEAYRTLRTNLVFSQALQSLHTLVVTSAAPGEGKTTTAANLAVTFAQQGIRVLLMDGDLRKPRLHRVFGLRQHPGVSSIIIGQAATSDGVRPTAVEGLFVLPAGTLPPNPGEFMGGDRMPELLSELRREFDVIIIDTPPLLAASDAAVLGSRADGVLLVVRAGDTERAAARLALHQLRTVGAHVVGAVLNDPDAKLPSYEGHEYYSYAGYYDEAGA